MNIVDLHVHSNKSDGSLSPSELVSYAHKKGLSAIALTDHDTIDGIDEAVLASKDLPIEVIPGIEFSTEYHGKDIHILGLFIEYTSPEIQTQIKSFVDSRDLRNQKLCDNLVGAGIDISYDRLLASYPGAVITRAHYARYLLEHHYIKSLPEAFDRYIGDHCKYFVPREKVTPTQAVELILAAKGLPILAHPILYHLSNEKLELLVQELTAAGLVGIEALYPTYSQREERLIRSLASRYHLALSGGSDFHGAAKPKLEIATGYGKLVVPESLLLNLKQLRKELFHV